jgi:type VI protein secretion system component VasF
MSQSTLGDLTETVTDVLSDAWSTSAALAQELASTAVDQVGHASEAVLTIVDTARERVQPTPRRRLNPWFLVAAALAAALAVGWFVRRRRADDAVAGAVTTSDLSDYRAAAGR